MTKDVHAKEPSRKKLFDLVAAQHTALCLAGKDIPFHRYEERREIRDAADTRATEVLTDAGGTIRDGGFQGIVFQVGGLQSSSTSGLNGALSNWLAQARKNWGLS